MIDFLRNLFAGSKPEPVTGRPRSSRWPSVRRGHLAEHPACEACGTTEDVEVHHVIPYHIQPRLELDSFNLMTLCGDKATGCHFRIGHGLNWSNINGNVRADATYFREMLKRIREANNDA